MLPVTRFPFPSCPHIRTYAETGTDILNCSIQRLLKVRRLTRETGLAVLLQPPARVCSVVIGSNPANNRCHLLSNPLNTCFI